MPPAGPIQAPARGLQEQACVLQTCTACNGATMRQNCDPDETIRISVLDSTFHPCAEQPDPWEACRLIVPRIRQNSENALIWGDLEHSPFTTYFRSRYILISPFRKILCRQICYIMGILGYSGQASTLIPISNWLHILGICYIF